MQLHLSFPSSTVVNHGWSRLLYHAKQKRVCIGVVKVVCLYFSEDKFCIEVSLGTEVQLPPRFIPVLAQHNCSPCLSLAQSHVKSAKTWSLCKVAQKHLCVQHIVPTYMTCVDTFFQMVSYVLRVYTIFCPLKLKPAGLNTRAGRQRQFALCRDWVLLLRWATALGARKHLESVVEMAVPWLQSGPRATDGRDPASIANNNRYRDTGITIGLKWKNTHLPSGAGFPHVSSIHRRFVAPQVSKSSSPIHWFSAHLIASTRLMISKPFGTYWTYLLVRRVHETWRFP